MIKKKKKSVHHMTSPHTLSSAVPAMYTLVERPTVESCAACGVGCVC